MSYEHAGMGTNGKDASSFPSGPMGPGELEERISEEFVFDASGRGSRRTDVAREEAEAASREAASEERRANWAARLQAWNQQCETQPEQCAAATVPLCAFVSLLPGAIIGAIASPKGERWGGAKWGALASAATCPIGIATARLGAIGGLIKWGAGIAAPIYAARYRLQRKRERGELPANPRPAHKFRYPFYVVVGNRIESAWDYREDGKDRVKELKEDSGIRGRVISAKGLERMKIDAADRSSWANVWELQK